MSPEQYCREKAAASGSSFYYSFFALPEDRRSAIIALYAFCREIDDAVDDCSDPALARVKLQWWREELKNAFDGRAQHPVTRALTRPIRLYDLSVEHFMEIIDGMQMDIDVKTYETFPDLSLYCYRVAGVVGLMAAEIFGYRDRGTRKYAVSLGTALQLTNIIRDVREDAAKGRIYIPMEDLDRFGVAPRELYEFRSSLSIRALLEHQAQRAHDYYDSAVNTLPEEDRYNQRSGLIMAAIYRALLLEIQRDGYRVLEHRINLTPIRKFWLAWNTLRREKRRRKRHQRASTAHSHGGRA